MVSALQPTMFDSGGTHSRRVLVNTVVAFPSKHTTAIRLLFIVFRLTDPDFEGNWTPDDEYLDADLPLKYARALYFSLVITYGNDLSETCVKGFAYGMKARSRAAAL